MRRRSLALFFTAIVVALTACSDDEASSFKVAEQDAGLPDTAPDTTPDVAPQPEEDVGLPDVAPPQVPVAVETQVLLSTLRAGDRLDVSCVVIDQNGEEMDAAGLTFRTYLRPESSFQVGTDAITAIRAGAAQVQCGVVEYGLLDPTPEDLVIEPGPAHTVSIVVDSHHVRAGESIQAACEAVDAWGNPVEIAPQLRVSPTERVTISGMEASFEVAEVYEVSCHVDGAVVEQSATIEVVPADPANLAVSLVPNQDVYGIGEVIEVAYVVTDKYGNEIKDADVTVAASPTGESFGDGRFRFGAEGTYTLTTDVNGTTEGGVTLHDERSVVINSFGPSIVCDAPIDGAMIDMAPGAQLNFTGRVADANGIAGVTIDGAPVTVNPDGSFAAPLNVRWGINYVQLTATDQYGVENSKFCSFLVSDDWQAEGVASYLDNGVIMRLNPAAIDDNNRSDLDSLSDVLDTVLNSAGLRNQLHTSLLAANPLKPSACDSQTCTFLGCVCWFRSEVIYQDTQINGPNTTTMSLVNGGLRIQARINNVRVKVRVRGHVSGIPYDTEGWVTVSYLDVDLVLNVTSSAGRPRATVRSVSTSVGTVSTSFSGLDGAIVNIVVDLFNGTVRNLIRDQIQAYVRDNFNSILDGVFSSLDIESLGSSFAVPRLDGNGQVTLTFGVNLTGLDVTTARARFGLGARIRPQTVAVGLPSLGTALPPQALDLEPAGSQPVVVAVYVAILNQALHSLWRGGFLNADLGAAFSGNAGLPAGMHATVTGLLPPVVENIAGNKVRLMLGAMQLNLVYPGIFDEGLPVTLGATATTSVGVANNALQFGVVTLENLYFSTDSVSLDATTRAVIENFLAGLVQGIVNASLNNALPSLPIPSFTLPASLSAFGLPANATLTISTTSTAQTTSQYILRGNFAIQ